VTISMTQSKVERQSEDSPWAPIIHDALLDAAVRQVMYVPDAGHARLIELCRATPEMTTTVLTTEEEGVAVAAGAWLGGDRSVLLMQSSGVGNCINMLSLISACRVPFLTVVTMRGEYREFNPWQVPMGSTAETALQMMNVRTIRIERLDDLEDQMGSAAAMAYESDQAIAVILSQRLLGAKKWAK
jgi:sulfopyruvate decarboxylase alpha subunit